MKKISLLFLTCLTFTSVFAQKPAEGDMGFSFGLQGLDFIGATTNFGEMSTLLYRYYLQDDLALRTRLNLTLDQSKEEFSDTSGFSTEDIVKSNNVELNIGLQKNWGLAMERIEPYATAEVVLGFGKTGISESTTVFDEDNSVKIEVDPGSTFSFGIVSHAGFNYFFTDYLALGAEFGYGFVLSSTGEGTTTTTTEFDGDEIVNTEETGTASSWTLGGRGGEVAILFSVFFR